MKVYHKYLTLAFLLFLAMASQAMAGGYYVGIQGGGAFLPEAKASDSSGSFNISYDPGYDVGITAGYDLGNDHPNIGNGRVELEFNTSSNDMDTAEFVDSRPDVNGSLERTSLMVNTIGEYVTESGMIIYALLGVGWAKITLDNVSVGEKFSVDDNDSQFAYQAGLGIAWRPSSHWTVDLGYRYLGTTDPTFTTKEGSSLDYEYDCHRLMVGLRLNFL